MGDKANFRLSDRQDPVSIKSLYGQVKDLFNPNVTKNMHGMTPQEAKEVALNINPVMSTVSKFTQSGPLAKLMEMRQSDLGDYYDTVARLPKGLDGERNSVLTRMMQDIQDPEMQGLKTFFGGMHDAEGIFQPKGGFSVLDTPEAISKATNFSANAGDAYIPNLGNFTNPNRSGLGTQMLSEIRNMYPGTVSLTPTSKSMDFYERAGMTFNPETNMMELAPGAKVNGYAQGGVIPPHQPSKMNNTFMAGGLNIINPKNKNKGPLNVQWNANNLIAKARTI